MISLAMPSAGTKAASSSSDAGLRSRFGEVLRAWRKRRRYTQLDLALEAEVSARHLSFMETGRSQPSREMVLILASVLEVPLSERNAMLHAAGFAPAYRSDGLDGADAEPIKRALRFMLQRNQPYPAVVVDPGWNVVMANHAHVRVASWLTGHVVPLGDDSAIYDTPPIQGSNLLLPLFDPDGLRGAVRNFEQIAGVLLGHLRRAAHDEPSAQVTLAAISAQGAADIDIGAEAGMDAGGDASSLVIPLVLAAGGVELSLFTTMTMLGTATDTVLSSLRLETYFPADSATDEAIRAIVAGS